MLEKYEKSELEFDVIPILKDILISIKEDLDEKEKKWINNELTLGDKSRNAVHHWKEVSRFLPRYLSEDTIATVYKGNIIKNLIMDCQSYTKYRPNETTGGIFVSWRRKEELPTGA